MFSLQVDGLYRSTRRGARPKLRPSRSQNTRATTCSRLSFF